MAAEVIPVQTAKFVPKDWGYESWHLNDVNHNLCQKTLFVKAGKKSSIHKHPIKAEVITCESGCLVVEYLQGDPEQLMRTGIHSMVALQIARLQPGWSIMLHPGDWHRLSAEHDTWAYESSTYHDDSDVRRIDKWEELLGDE